MSDPTRRLADRVADYARWRPGYPSEVLAWLRATCGLAADWIVADLGSGTGLLARLFLENGNRVAGVEPNREMREAGDRILATFPRFSSVAATAEATTLPDASADLVTAGQSFHWFDAGRALPEMVRILRPAGWVALAWNDRLPDATAFLAAYESLLLSHSPDYAAVDHRRFDAAALRGLLGPEVLAARFPNGQDFDFEGLRGRLLSSSYAPPAGHPRHEPMLLDLRRVFDAHAVDGRVSFLYDTEVTAVSRAALARRLGSPGAAAAERGAAAPVPAGVPT